ncbi:MAG: hypothetical protein CVU46_09525 [Chloroflexi bacterium HGW-Chloroflexi-8]|jgi:hypothetical protein|nr:MAG: hypothetical protein CVU46_09525 [Chloroflexi bacterium HGW-Chloroflexi-8]
MTNKITIDLGDIYLVPNEKYDETHYHVVIVKSKDNWFLLVPLNSMEKLDHRLQDPACVLNPGEIPGLLKRKTQVTYKKSMLIKCNELLALIKSKDAKLITSTNGTTLEKIQQSITKSRKVPVEILDFYINNKMFA